MIIKCVVQLELIQAIDNIVFYPNVSRHDDQAIMEFAQVMYARDDCSELLGGGWGVFEFWF